MRNAEIAEAFDELADRLAIIDPKPYRWMAYRRAAATFRDLGDSIALLSAEGRLAEVPGVGAAIEEKVAALLDTGSMPALDRARADVPDTLLALTRLPGIGAATAKKIYATIDGESIDSLMQRAAAGTLETGGGITKKVVDTLASTHAARADGELSSGATGSGVPRDPGGQPLLGPWFRRDQAHAMIETVSGMLRAVVDVRGVDVGGEYARGLELVRDIELLVVTREDAGDAANTRAAIVDTLTARGYEHDDTQHPEPLALVSPSGMPILVTVVPSSDEARARAMLGGPPAWAAVVDEPGASDVPLELRDAVLGGRYTVESVPRDVVTVADLRGELHAHSDWSDGKATILQMAHAARARGDEYFAVCDHSAPYAMVNGLDPARLQAQADEIATVNEQLQREHEQDGEPLLTVLRGTELEILADGSLGLPDSALATLDWVVASIHVQQRQAADVVLERMRRVLDNPLVDAIGHPTSRRLLRRERTALDVEQLIAMAVEQGAALEINANPDRLDLDSDHAAMALAAGALLTINTDAHRTSTLALRDHGVAVARRAGARPENIVNCLSWSDLQASRRRNR